MRRACAITLTNENRATLERWSRSRSTEARLVERSRIVLLAAEGREKSQGDGQRQRLSGDDDAGTSATQDTLPVLLGADRHPNGNSI